jgi:hypothetical protein
MNDEQLDILLEEATDIKILIALGWMDKNGNKGYLGSSF